ncbi:MAG: hypothetical protein QOK15_1301 [Nocardioidaceae bacterium]|jgi:hypothetical protein|nr:hypothetical protein [Nocardioidaceae bacterium]
MSQSGDGPDYAVLVHREAGGYRAEVDELPGFSVSAASLTELWDAFERDLSQLLSRGDRKIRVVLTKVEQVEGGRVERYDAQILVG